MSMRICGRCHSEEVTGIRRRLCSACREESRRESRLEFYHRNREDINASRRIQGEVEEVEDEVVDALWAGTPAYERTAKEEPYRHVVNFFPPAESSQGSFYGSRGYRDDRMPDGWTSPEAYGITRASSAPAPAQQPTAWNRFGQNVEPPARIYSGHNIGPAPHLEVQEAAETEYTARVAEHHRAQVRQSLDFRRGV
jgi:hypothetical protein